MSVTDTYSLFAVQAGANMIGAVTSQRMPLNSQVLGEPTSSSPYIRHTALVAQNPAAEFSSFAIAKAINAITATGADIAGLTGGLNFWAQKRLAGSTRAGATSHRKYGNVVGVVFPVTLQGSHQQDVSIDCGASIVHNGSVDPVVITENQTLPSGDTDDERFTLHSITLGGIVLPQWMDFNLAFNVNVIVKGSNSDIWPTYAYIESIKPVFTFSGTDPTWVKSDKVPLTGLAGTHANTTIKLRKRLNKSTFVPDATPQHIVITANGIITPSSGFEAQTDSDASVSVDMNCIYDGTNDPVKFNTASAI